MGSEARTTGRGFRDPAQRLLGFALASLTVVLIGDTARAVTLTEDGQSRATIVLENNPSDASRLAVQDLAMYLEKVSGAEVPLVDAGQPVETPATMSRACLLLLSGVPATVNVIRPCCRTRGGAGPNAPRPPVPRSPLR